MKTRLRRLIRSRQTGVAAVELALVLPVLVVLLTSALLFGRIFWYYTVTQKAAHDAARYIASIPANEMRSQGRVSAYTQVGRDIAMAETADLDLHDIPTVSVRCDAWECVGGTAPQNVGVRLQMRVHDDIFGLQPTGGDGDGWLLTAEVNMPYVGD